MDGAEGFSCARLRRESFSRSLPGELSLVAHLGGVRGVRGGYMASAAEVICILDVLWISRPQAVSVAEAL